MNKMPDSIPTPYKCGVPTIQSRVKVRVRIRVVRVRFGRL